MLTDITAASSTTVTALTDRELVARILEGEREQQGELYNRYCDRVYYKCLSMVKEANLAQDMTHDVFIKVFTNLYRYRGKADLSFWIYAITYNHCISHLRKSKRLRFDELDGVNEPQDHAAEELSDKLLKELRIHQLEGMLRKLGPEEEILLTMKYQDGMSIRQMAGILQLGESAVKMRLKRTRSRLAALLTESPDAR